MFAGFGGGDAGVGGEAVEMLEAVCVGPGWKLRVAKLGEAYLEADGIDAGVGMAYRDGAADAGVAAFDGHLAELEANDAAKLGADEAVFPESGDAVDLERGAETEAGFGDVEAGEPLADGVQRSCGNDGGAAGDEVIGDAVGVVTDHYGLIEKFAEPCGGCGGVAGECEGGVGDFAGIKGRAKSDAREIRGVGGANQVHTRGAGGADDASVEGAECPGAVELEAAGGADGGGGDFYGVEGFDGVDLDAGEAGMRFHLSILAGAEKIISTERIFLLTLIHCMVHLSS
jgi:hypothetical protein